MTINEIQYSQTIQVNEGSWVKIGLKASLDPNDNPDEAYLHLQQKVNQYHSTTPPLPIKSRDKVVDEKEGLIRSILSCKELEGEDGLKSFYLPARNTPGALEIYNAQLNKLING